MIANPRRILIIKPSALGDVVHTLPVLNLLRRRWPEAHIAWLISPVFAGLVEGHPQLDQVIRFDRRRYARAWRSLLVASDLLDFVLELRRQSFDLVIDLQGLFRSGWLTASTQAPCRVGFARARELAPLFYTHRIETGPIEQHAVDRYLRICRALGCGSEPVEFRFHVTDEDQSAVDRMLSGLGPFAVLLPGTNWPTKRWPVENYAALVGPLRERLGLTTVTAGGPDAVELAGRIPADRDLTGKTSLPQLVALLNRADLVIANDSGPMHIASALNRPLVSIFGPTNPVRTGPYRRLQTVVRLELPCSPCYSRRCRHTSCMNWLKVEPVLEAAEAALNATPGLKSVGGNVR